ncbi:ABC transporter permease [Gordonia aichiensis]|uniref:ABC transporter permease n=1 Tax=Gordonia aichiensis TaxID=36820 RepID=UPI003264142E
MRATDRRLTVGSMRELSAVGIVCGLAAAYGGLVLTAADVLGAAGEHTDGALAVVLGIVATVFIMIALFVSSLVIAHGVDTVIVGRAQHLQMLRLVGASARQLRVSLLRGVAQVAAIGAGVGLVVGVGLADIARVSLVSRGVLPDIRYGYLPPTTLIAASAVVVTAVIATHFGSRRVLSGAPADPSANRLHWLRRTVAVVALGVGALLLAAACLLGEEGSSAGFAVAFLGTALTCLGLLIGAPLVVPAAVAAVSAALGRGPAATLARKNAVADPGRTTRSTIGLLIGVTLVTTVVAGMSSLQDSVDRWGLTAEQLADNRQGLEMMTWVLAGLIGISVVIAAVGFISTMSLTVVRRTREIGVLRALGFTARQVRGSIACESLALSGTAMVGGLVLGIVFGAIGSQSLLGALTPGFPIGVPPAALLAIVAGTVGLAAAAAVVPSRRAVSVPPVDALAVV